MNRRSFLGTVLAACVAPHLLVAKSTDHYRWRNGLLVPDESHFMWAERGDDGNFYWQAGTPPFQMERLPPYYEVSSHGWYAMEDGDRIVVRFGSLVNKPIPTSGGTVYPNAKGPGCWVI